MKITILLIVLFMVCHPAWAAESFYYAAPVIEVEEIVAMTPKPGVDKCLERDSTDLESMLYWDLNCYGLSKVKQEPARYRVTYEIDGNRFVTMRHTHPGNMIDVKLSARTL